MRLPFLPLLATACLPSLTKVTSANPEPDTPGLLTREFIYETAPFPSCHASTLAETKTGIVAAWFGGQHEKHPSVGIWVSLQQDGKWSTPVEVANGVQPDGKRLPCWNPVLFQPSKEGAPLLLFYKVGPSPREWWGMLRTSSDGGKTWSDAAKLPDGILGPIKNKPIELAGGVLLCPTSTESNDAKNEWRVHFEFTPDLGKTWTKSFADPGEVKVGAIQPSILQHPDGKLQALGRTRAKKVFQTWSEDQGKTWSPLTLTDLPNSNAGTDAVTLADGRHLLVFNNTPNGRTPLSLALSHDGKTWHVLGDLENARGEYSYPACIQTKDGKVHVTYTWKREKVRHVVLDPAKWVIPAKP